MIKKLQILFLPATLLVSFLLSSRMILSGDFLYLADQSRAMLLVKQIVIDHKIPLIGERSGIGGFFHGPLWLFILSPFSFIFHENPFGFSIFYIILALLIVLVGYLVGKRLYGVWVGLAIAFLLATSQSIWSYVPITINANIMPLNYLLLFFFLILYIRGNKRIFPLAVFFSGLTFQFETASAIAIVPIVFLSFFLNKKARFDLKIILLSLLAFLISISTFILFELRHQFIMSKSLLQFLTAKTHGMGHMTFLERIPHHLKSLFDLYQSLLVDENLILLLLLFVNIAFASYLLVRNKKQKLFFKKEYLFLLLFPAATFLIYLFYPYIIYHEYVLGLIIPVAIITALAFKINWENKVGKILIGLFLVGTAILTAKNIYLSYLKPYYPDLTSGSYKNQKRVVDWIISDAKGNEFGYFVYSPDTFTYGMDYLLWWEGRGRNVKPVSQKEKVTYLIMYPPITGDASAHEFWKKNIIKTDAPVLIHKEYTGGIVVEKMDLSKDKIPVDTNYYQNLIFR